ncbi:hypothetical protein E3N88_40781 [Mikania micrantha]|uniref:Pentatricopeptide repeat-containing protein n=1 Tax=Mikania micrantha TaxID=192012 RepID=A0A5N6LNR1_9ASTR|nr:hypothetical protein E3N88_40781 [Mikania micrantha]
MLVLGGWNSLAAPDDYTFSFTITARSRHLTLLGYSQNCHMMVIKLGYDSDVCVGNAFVSMYVVFSKIVYAQKVFDEMSQRDIITWTSLLKGCAMSGKTPEAETYQPLIDMYAKCGKTCAGRLEDAFKAVKTTQMMPDDVIWRALLSACRVHENVGQCKTKRKSKIHNEDDSTPGCSYIEIDGVAHEFLVADKLHPHIMEDRWQGQLKSSLESELLWSSTVVDCECDGCAW